MTRSARALLGIRQKVFFYRYRAMDGAFREIRLGDVGALTPAEAREATLRKRH